MPSLTYKPLKTTKDAKGITLYTTITFDDGTKERLRKRVKESDLEFTKRYWTEMLDKGLNPLSKEDEKVHHKVSGKVTFREAYLEFQKSFVGNPDTLTAYKAKLKIIDDELGNREIKKIDTFTLTELLKRKIQDGSYAQSTLNQGKKIFNIFFNWCVGAKYISESPSADIGKLKSDKDTEERLNPFTEDDFNKIMERVKAEPNPSLYYNINFIYHACLRPSEIQNLKVKDVDMINKRIRVKASIAKSNSLDYVPIYPQLENIIKSMKIDEADADAYLFSRDSKSVKKPICGQFKHRDDFFADWFREGILKPLGLYEGFGYSLYCFKHSSNIHKVDASWKTSELQKLNRHSSIDQTLTYLSKIRKVTNIEHLQSRSI